MKVDKIKGKVAAKVAKAKGKVAAKRGKAVKCVLFLFALAVFAVGCATAEAPTAQRAQNIKAEDVRVTYNINVNAPASVPATFNAVESADKPVPVSFNFTTEVATAAQANETSGTETMTNTPAQKPTSDVKPQTSLTYGLSSSTPSGAKWVNSLDAGCAELLSSWLGSGKANGTMEVTKKDGTKETVECKGGTCTTSSGECITSGECSDCQPK